MGRVPLPPAECLETSASCRHGERSEPPAAGSPAGDDVCGLILLRAACQLTDANFPLTHPKTVGILRSSYHPFRNRLTLVGLLLVRGHLTDSCVAGQSNLPPLPLSTPHDLPGPDYDMYAVLFHTQPLFPPPRAGRYYRR